MIQRARTAVAAACLMLCSLAVAPPASAQDQTLPLAREVAGSTQQLEALRRQITSVRGDLADLSDRRQDADQALAQVTREIGLVRELLAGLDQRERILVLQRDSLQVDLAAHQETYDLRRRNLAARLRALYKQGPQRDLELILTSESFSALVARLKFGAMLARLDGSLVEQTRQQGLRIQTEQQHLQVALAGIWEAREEARMTASPASWRACAGRPSNWKTCSPAWKISACSSARPSRRRCVADRSASAAASCPGRPPAASCASTAAMSTRGSARSPCTTD